MAKLCIVCDEAPKGLNIVCEPCHADEIEGIRTEEDIEQQESAYTQLLHELRYRHLPNYRVVCDA